VIRWGKKQIEKEEGEGPKKERLKKKLKNVIRHIRFPLMSPDQLWDFVEPFKYLVPLVRNERQCCSIFN